MKNEDEDLNIPYDHERYIDIGEKAVALNKEDNAPSCSIIEEESSEWDEVDKILSCPTTRAMEKRIESEPELPLKMRLRGAQELKLHGEVAPTHDTE